MKEVEIAPATIGERIKCQRYECDLVTKNPGFIGINLDHDHIVDARGLFTLDEAAEYLRRKYELTTDELDYSQAESYLSTKRTAEDAKEVAFYEYLSKFKNRLRHARIHPSGGASPISPSQALKITPDRAYSVAITPRFFKQMKALKRAQVDDLTLVIPFYDHRRAKREAADIPKTQEQIEQYISLCTSVIENIGEDIQLEIGNETNVSRDTDKMFADESSFVSHVDPIEYGKFFFEVAKKIKAEKPTTKLSIAGVACFDPTYLREALAEINRLQTAVGIGHALVDTISFHPYREDPEGGSIEVKNGNFVSSHLNYKKQMATMKNLASEFDIKLNVGEINFSLFDPRQEEKLNRAITLTAEAGLVSLIYPGINVHH